MEARSQALVAERQAMLARLQTRPDAHEAEWLQGLDDLSPGTIDVLTVTILLPE